MTASESPYDRHGAAANLDRRRRVQLHGGQRQSVFSIAHEYLGEWRDWWRVSRENGLNDPFNLADVEHIRLPSFITFDGDDATADSGVGPVLITASPELAGDAVIEVQDIDVGVFELRLVAPGEEESGEPVVVTEDEFFDDEGESVARRFTLTSFRERYFIFFEIDLDGLLMLWLFRPVAIRLAVARKSTEVVVPQPALGAGRGEL